MVPPTALVVSRYRAFAGEATLPLRSLSKIKVHGGGGDGCALATASAGEAGAEGAAGDWKDGRAGEDGSGDLFLAFSTQATLPATPGPVATVATLDNERMNPLFEGTVQATQEAILNAMLAANTMTGVEGIRVYALPQGAVDGGDEQARAQVRLSR